MRPRRAWLLLAAAAAAISFAAAPSADGRELHWRELAVSARLDADGRLHISERHEMVFTGDWNGGERVFDVRAGQRLELHRVARIDPSGRTIELSKGSYEKVVDRYGWSDSQTLRWRSRLPGDPPFDRTVLTYVLDYTLSGILVANDRPDVWTLDHEFAFATREGAIERLVVDLELDPVWEPPAHWQDRHEAHDLPPGESWVRAWQLVYTADGIPAAAPHPTPRAYRLGVAAAAGAAILFFLDALFRREAKLGRLSRPDDLPAEPDRAWIDEHLLSLPAEQVGALWDRRVGTAEVAGLLARLVEEGRLESEVEPKRHWFGSEVLRLRLAAPRDSFKGYERALINKLFFKGRTETDTEAVRKHHSAKGFDPVALIRGGIDSALKRRGKGQQGALPPWRSLVLLAACALAFLLEGTLGNGPAAIFFAFFLVLPTLPVFGIGTATAAVWRDRIERVVPAAFWWILFGLVVLAAALALVFLDEIVHPGVLTLYPGHFGVIGMLLVPVLVFSVFTNQAASRETPRAIRRRQELAHARRHLARQLRRERPDLDDRWLPHLIALGLGDQVSRWGKRWSVAAAGAGGGTSALAGSSGSFSGGGRGWSGGGGAFGGAGASAAWATAAAGMASSVASPSSGGSGGGGGGGGSSGGGGGGGW